MTIVWSCDGGHWDYLKCSILPPLFTHTPAVPWKHVCWCGLCNYLGSRTSSVPALLGGLLGNESSLQARGACVCVCGGVVGCVCVCVDWRRGWLEGRRNHTNHEGIEKTTCFPALFLCINSILYNMTRSYVFNCIGVWCGCMSIALSNKLNEWIVTSAYDTFTNEWTHLRFIKNQNELDINSNLTHNNFIKTFMLQELLITCIYRKYTQTCFYYTNTMPS